MNEQRISSARDADEIDLREVGRTLMRRAWVIAATLSLGLGAAYVYGETRAPQYTARATLIPTETSGNQVAAAMAPFGGFSPSGVIPRGDAEKLIGLLGSRVLAERVVSRPYLKQQLSSVQSGAEPLTMGEAYGLLQRMMTVSEDKTTGIIEVKAKHADPVLSARVANAYVDELDAFLQENSFTAARRQREFLQKQVRDLSGEIKQIEGQLIAFQEKHQLVSLDAQTNATINTYSSLKSQLIAKEMELQLMSTSVSPHDLGLIGLKQEVQLLRGNLASLETGAAGGLLAFKDAPRLGVQYAQFQRDLTVKQKVFELLTQQLELAKIEETRDSLSFQVIDRAAIPESAGGTKRATIWFVGAVLSLALGLFLALSLDKRMGRKRVPKRSRPKQPIRQFVPIPRESL